MKYCSNCGQPLREGVKVCTNCGTPVQRFSQHRRHSQYSDQRRPYQQSVNKQSQSPKDNKKILDHHNNCFSSINHIICCVCNIEKPIVSK